MKLRKNSRRAYWLSGVGRLALDGNARYNARVTIRNTAIAAALFTLAACAGAMLPPLTPSQTSWAVRQWPGTSGQDIAASRELYLARCSGCHAVKPPLEHTITEWRKWVGVMAPRAKITPEQQEEILRYLAAAKATP